MAARGRGLKIEYLPTGELIPDSRNARRHTAKQIARLADIIQAFGWSSPIVIDEDKVILAGHARLAAARTLGLHEVPCICLCHLTAAQKTALAIADNKMSDESTFDDDALRQALIELTGLDFDIELTGFDTAAVDFLIDGGTASGRKDPDDAFEAPTVDQKAVSRTGDLWLLGKHRLYCGDALADASFETVLGEDRAQMVISDPPYNVPVLGHVSGLGRVKHREFAMASGEMSEREFGDFLAAAMALMARFSVDGSIHFLFMDWRHIQALLEAGRSHYAALKNICVWAKTNAGMGSLYRSQHELVAVFKSGTAPHINNVELGKHGRYRTNLWTFAGANAFGAARDADLEAHPTVKPVTLVAEAIRDCSKRRGVILDPFVGSGTTILAAERTGRRAAAIEIDPLYVDTAIRRWQSKTGGCAVLAADGRSFDDLARARLDDPSGSMTLAEGGC